MELFSVEHSKTPISYITKNDFDLIFFHTEQYPFKFIQTACASPWCHIGMILILTQTDIENIRHAMMGHHPHHIHIHNHHHHTGTLSYSPPEVYILESTQDVFPCVVTGKAHPGVKISLLKDRLKAYGCSFCGYKKIRYQKVTGSVVTKQVLLYSILPEVLGLPYEKHLFHLFRSWVHYIGLWMCSGGIDMGGNKDSMFCSELIAHIFTSLGVMHSVTRYNMPEQLNTTLLRHEQPLYTNEDMVPEDFVHVEKFQNSDERMCISYYTLKTLSITPECFS